MSIKFVFATSRVSLPERKKLKLFIENLFRKNKKELDSLTIVFCNDQFLLDINKKFLNHNYYTDIITFNIADPHSSIVGEIYISTDRVRDNAISLAPSFKNELHRVIFHGALHLCGYDDKTKQGKKQMTKAEDNCLSLYFS